MRMQYVSRMLGQVLAESADGPKKRDWAALQGKVDPADGGGGETVVPKPGAAGDGDLVAAILQTVGKIEQITAQSAGVAGGGQMQDSQRRRQIGPFGFSSSCGGSTAIR